MLVRMNPVAKFLRRSKLRFRMTIVSRWQRLWIGIFWSMTTGRVIVPTAIEQLFISGSSLVPNKDFRVIRVYQDRWEEAERLERQGFWHRAVKIREEILVDLYNYQGITDINYFPPILGTTWTTNFGHLALIGYHKLAQQLKIVPSGDRFVLDNDKNANPDLLREISNGMHIITQKSGTSWSDMPTFWHLSERMRTIKMVDGFIDTNKLVDEIFSDSNLNLLKDNFLHLSNDYSMKSLEKLEEFGLPKSSKFVALHVREGGPIGDPRNQSISSFISAVNEITKNGFWVVRLGDNSMAPMPSMNMVIDLVPKKNSAKELHAYVIANCVFFLGTHSGPAWLPRVFGVPSLITNVVEVATKVARAPRGSIYLPKKFINRKGRMLTLSEMFNEGFAFSALFLHELKSKGFSLESNTSNEILEATKEIIENINGAKNEPSIFRESVNLIRHRYDAPVWGDFSDSFISKNPEWLN
jgi:putative glycosyltransferase (TIGR04372 family)